MKLLVVDDSLVVRNALSRWAVPGPAGAAVGGAITEVVRASDGLEAVELFRSLRPELVTMDLTMPRLDGLGAISALLELEPHTSILVISALNNHAVALDAIQRGACGFLTKPFTESEVRHALDRLVDHARQQPR